MESQQLGSKADALLDPPFGGPSVCNQRDLLLTKIRSAHGSRSAHLTTWLPQRWGTRNPEFRGLGHLYTSLNKTFLIEKPRELTHGSLPFSLQTARWDSVFFFSNALLVEIRGGSLINGEVGEDFWTCEEPVAGEQVEGFLEGWETGLDIDRAMNRDFEEETPRYIQKYQNKKDIKRPTRYKDHTTSSGGNCLPWIPGLLARLCVRSASDETCQGVLGTRASEGKQPDSSANKVFI